MSSQQPSSTNRTFLDKFLRDKDGRVALIQFPSPLLFVWIAATLLERIFTSGILNSSLVLVALISLIVWSYLEITSGANYFRRGLGVVVLVITIMNFLMH